MLNFQEDVQAISVMLHGHIAHCDPTTVTPPIHIQIHKVKNIRLLLRVHNSSPVATVEPIVGSTISSTPKSPRRTEEGGVNQKLQLILRFQRRLLLQVIHPVGALKLEPPSIGRQQIELHLSTV